MNSAYLSLYRKLNEQCIGNSSQYFYQTCK